MSIISRKASELVGGETVETEDETLWGFKNAQHKVCGLKCDLQDHLIVFELRDGPVLRYLLRLSPSATVKVCTRIGA